MIKAEQIPDAVLEAHAKAAYEHWRMAEDLMDETLPWEEVEEDVRIECRANSRAAILKAEGAQENGNG